MLETIAVAATAFRLSAVAWLKQVSLNNHGMNCNPGVLFFLGENSP
jgi:hypothetical protein